MCIKSSMLSTFDEKKQFLKGLWAFKFDTGKKSLYFSYLYLSCLYMCHR